MSISILCVHGINHGDLDPDLEGSWSRAICDGLIAWKPEPQGNITCYFTGHGTQMPVYGPTDEADRMDECLVPHDFDWTPEHAVTDKQFLNLYSQLPYDSHFTAIFDCCHSGGMTRETRGITPPDDIRHRALRWNAELQMWEDRPYASPNPSLAEKGDTRYLGNSGASYRIGRAISLRSMAKKQYDATRKTLKHHGPYLPIILEACQEEQLSYEYRHGTQSYGAFTYSLAATLRESRGKKVNPSFVQLMDGITRKPEVVKYPQVPNLVGAREVLREGVPWGGGSLSSAAKGKRGKR